MKLPSAGRRIAQDFARGCSCRDGAAILEFALVLPILLALVAGCFEIGRMLAVSRDVGEAARFGARALASLPDPSCRPECTADATRILARVGDLIAESANVVPRAITVTIVADAPAGTVGVRAEVRLSADLLGALGLDHLMNVRAVRYEPRLGA